MACFSLLRSSSSLDLLRFLKCGGTSWETMASRFEIDPRTFKAFVWRTICEVDKRSLPGNIKLVTFKNGFFCFFFCFFVFKKHPVEKMSNQKQQDSLSRQKHPKARYCGIARPESQAMLPHNHSAPVQSDLSPNRTTVAAPPRPPRKTSPPPQSTQQPPDGSDAEPAPPPGPNKSTSFSEAEVKKMFSLSPPKQRKRANSGAHRFAPAPSPCGESPPKISGSSHRASLPITATPLTPPPRQRMSPTKSPPKALTNNQYRSVSARSLKKSLRLKPGIDFPLSDMVAESNEIEKETHNTKDDSRTPPITPPWRDTSTSLSSLTYSTSSDPLSPLTFSLCDSLSPTGFSREKKSSMMSSLRLKQKLKKKSMMLEKGEDIFSPPTPTSSHLSCSASFDSNKVFLLGLPESEVIFFPLHHDSAFSKKRKQDKQDGSQPQTIQSLRGNLNREEEDRRAKGCPELKAATQRVLISYLCSPHLATKKFISAFLLMYPSFMTSTELFDGLVRVVSKSETTNEETKEFIAAILSQWMTQFFKEDWTTDLQDKMQAFFLTNAGESLLSLHTPSSPLSRLPARPSLQSLLKTCAETADRPNNKSFGFLSKTLTTTTPEVSLDINSFQEDEIACSLTAYAFSIFKETREREFLAKEKEDSPHITQLVSLFNHLSMWVTSEIVTRTKLTDRVLLIRKLSNIAKRLLEDHNHLLCFAVVSGLTKSCIKRMNKTFSNLPSSCLSALQDLESTFSSANNFKNYRSLLDKTVPPCIPYTGVFQKDLIFMSDGNPNNIGNLINFSKRTRTFEILMDVSLCRQGEYEESLTPNRQFLSWLMNNAPILSEKEQFLWSRRVDPKDTEMVIAEFIEGEMHFLAQIQTLEQELQAEREKVAKVKAELEKRTFAATAPLVQKAPSLSLSSPSKQLHSTKRNKGFSSSYLHLFWSTRVEDSSSTHPSKWSVHEVVNWVEGCVGERWAASFEENEILGADFVEMEMDDLLVFVDDREVCEKLFCSIRAKLSETTAPALNLEPLRELSSS